MSHARLFIDASWTDGDSTAVVDDKFTGEPLAEMAQPSPAQISEAVAALERAQRQHVIPPYERFEILSRASRLVDERRERLRATIVGESGFTVNDADNEINRAVQTLRLSGEEAARLTGEMVPMEGAPGVRNRLGFTIRRPVGVVCAITPFNSPLNTVCHKVGPALAAGNAVVLKPASYTPLTAVALVEILLDAGLPPTHIALLHGSGGDVGTPLLSDPRISFYTFTGSTEVGRLIQRTVGLRRTQLELGSLSSTVICDDADLDQAVGLCVNAAYRKAGQVCTSIQRIYVDAAVIDEFTDRLVDEVARRPYGDPHLPDTFTGPLISLKDAERVASWIAGAVDGGAKALVGAERDDRVVAPTVLADVTPEMKVMREEVFGPVVSLRRFDSLDRAIDEVNDTPFGLAAGVFTRDISRGLRAAEHLRMGSVHINQTPSSRVDLMPYTGVKDSGFGHEGPRYAIREMTEERLVTISYGD